MALKRFVTTGGATTASVAAATRGITQLNGTAATRAAIYEWDFGTAAASAPVDENYVIRLIRSTVAGTWTAVTPLPLDPADAAAVATAGTIQTGAGTVAAAPLFSIGINARAGFRWVAIPDSELIIPATAAAGINIEYGAISTGATASNIATVFHQE
jgi:hypothetical protein